MPPGRPWTNSSTVGIAASISLRTAIFCTPRFKFPGSKILNVSTETAITAPFAAAETPPQAPVRDEHITIIQATSAWRLVDWRELYAYRDLFRFLTWRSIKVRYAQSAVG